MKTAFLFPGQGAQSPGMGADLYDSFDSYRIAFDRCASGAGLDLKAACFLGEGMDGSDVIQPQSMHIRLHFCARWRRRVFMRTYTRDFHSVNMPRCVPRACWKTHRGRPLSIDAAR